MNRVAFCGKLTAQPGQRDALVALLLQPTERLRDVAGCELYLVNTSPSEDDAVWVMEMWRDVAAHADSLADPDIRAIIGQALPLLAGRPELIDLIPVGGVGLEPGLGEAFA